MTKSFRCAAKILLALAAVAAIGGVVMLLWNWVMPALFASAMPLDYPHALGLLLLSRILFGGFRGHGGWHGRHHWRKWAAMSPEEREKLREQWHGHHHRQG